MTFFSKHKNLFKNRLINDRFQNRINKNVKLNIGCGGMYMEGYINIDCNPYVKLDLYLDFRNLNSIFSPSSVSEVVMIHSISYLNLWEARDYFNKLFLLLQKGGILILEFPDVLKCSKAIIESENNYQRYIEALRPFYAFDNDQIAKKEKYFPYNFGWSAWHLVEELRNVGFTEIQILTPETHGKLEWRDTRIEARK